MLKSVKPRRVLEFLSYSRSFCNPTSHPTGPPPANRVKTQVHPPRASFLTRRSQWRIGALLSSPANRQFHESLCTVARKSWKSGVPNAHRGPSTPHPHTGSPSSSASLPFMLLPPSCFLKFPLKYTICPHVLPLGFSWQVNSNQKHQ